MYEAELMRASPASSLNHVHRRGRSHGFGTAYTRCVESWTARGPPTALQRGGCPCDTALQSNVGSTGAQEQSRVQEIPRLSSQQGLDGSSKAGGTLGESTKNQSTDGTSR